MKPDLRLLNRLGERTRPHYGQLVLYTLLFCSILLSCYFVFWWGNKRASDVHTRAPTSLLSFLPADLLLHGWLVLTCGAFFAIGALLWAMRRVVPFSAWATAVAFNAVVALYLENSSQETHVAHVAGGFLLIYALWYHFYRKEIQDADREKRFWRSDLYPRWVYSLSVFYLGLFYGLSGFNKVAVSGLHWANGVPLQLWTKLFGFQDSIFSQIILSNRTAAAAMQWAALIGECGGLVAIVSARLRPVVGLLLIGFHIAQICVFGWHFETNMLMLALVFLPAYAWTPRVVAWWERRKEPRTK